MIYKYKIKGLKFFGYHGIYNSEQEQGQFFYFDVNYKVNYKKNNFKEIEDVIDYSLICKEIEFIFNSKRYDLLEVLLNDIIKHLKVKFPRLLFKLKVKKESNFMINDLKYVSVSTHD